MANNGRIVSNRTNGTAFYLQWQLVRQDVAGNYSVLNWQCGINIDNPYSYWGGNAVKINDCRINGIGLASGTWSNIRGEGDHQLRAGQITIYHNSDGSKWGGYSISGWLYASGNLDGGGGFSLPTIPRASSPKWSKRDYWVGETLTINMNRKWNGFTHDGTIQVPDNDDIKTFSGVAEQFNWTPTDDELDTIYERVPNSLTTSVGFDLLTKNNGATIGGTLWDNVTLHFVKEQCKPNLNSFQYWDTNSQTTKLTGNNTVLIENKSTVNVRVRYDEDRLRTQKYAWGVRYETSLGNKKVTADYTNENIDMYLGSFSGSGNLALSLTGYDSRGLSDTAIKTVKVIPYSSPVLNVTSERVNNFENTVITKISGNYSTVNVNGENKNSIKAIKYRYKQGDGSFNSWTSLTPRDNDGSFSTMDVYLSLINSSEFTIEVMVQDQLETVVRSTFVGRGIPLVMISDNKKAVGINKFPSDNRALDVNGDIFMNNKRVLTEGETNVKMKLYEGRATLKPNEWVEITIPNNLVGVELTLSGEIRGFDNFRNAVTFDDGGGGSSYNGRIGLVSKDPEYWKSDSENSWLGELWTGEGRIFQLDIRCWNDFTTKCEYTCFGQRHTWLVQRGDIRSSGKLRFYQRGGQPSPTYYVLRAYTRA